MNREIKFRAFDTYLQKMCFTGFHLFGEILTFGCLEQWCNENPNPKYEHSLERANDIVISQFTGLKDKNGVEIYEGDIIVSENDVNNYTYKIVFEFGMFRIENLTTKLTFPLAITLQYSKYIIIGNIYENPNLLDG
jgi:uncharacterized phage protein (TIGR01671 family)